MIDWAQLLRSENLDTVTPIEGLSEAEIQEIETANQVKLPAEYKHFLCACGRRAGEFLGEDYLFYPDILDLRTSFEEMVKEHGHEFTLPAQAFLFKEYQGWHFLYFVCDGHDDPPVLEVSSGDIDPRQICARFSEFMARGIKAYGEFCRKHDV